MNKDTQRLVIFIALSGLILFGFNYFYAPKQALKQAAAQQQAQPQTAQQASPGSAQAEAQKQEPARIQAPKGTAYTIDNSLFTAEFSTAGAVITSFKIKKYTDTASKGDKEESVNLVVNQFSGSYMALTSPLADYSSQLWNYGGTRTDGDRTTISFSRMSGGVLMVKEYTVTKDTYLVGMNLKFTNKTSAAVSLKDLYLEWGPNLHTSPEELAKQSGGIGYKFNRIVYQSNNKTTVVNINQKAKEGKIVVLSDVPDWIVMKDLYFMSSFIPVDGRQIRAMRIKEEPNGHAFMTVDFADISLTPGMTQNIVINSYLGPQEYKRLAKLKLQSTIDLGWTWIRPISVGMFYLMDFLHNATKNWGLSIILITIIIRGLLWFPSQNSYKHMKDTQKKMAVIQPRMDTMKKIYKDDPQKMNEEMMKLYKEYNINPFGGCLPMFLQMPIFFALYATLINLVDLKGAYFVWWLKDLSKPDHFYVLPVLMAVSMFVQQKMSTTVSPTPEAEQQQKIMLYGMPLLFGWMSLSWPAGLLLYWSVSNILSILQQVFVNKTK